MRARLSHGTAGVGPERRDHVAGRDRCARSGARAASRSTAIVRIAHATKVRVRRPVSELVQIRLRDEDCARVTQEPPALRIPRRHAIAVRGAAARRTHGGRVDVVLQRDRKAVQRPSVTAFAQLALSDCGGRERLLREDRRVRVELAIGLDVGEGLAHEIDRRHAAAAQQGGELGDRETPERQACRPKRRLTR